MSSRRDNTNKKQKKTSRGPIVPWARGFRPPCPEATEKALGCFPCAASSSSLPSSRRDALVRSSLHGAEHDGQVDDPRLYRPLGVPPLKKPADPNDWLAAHVERGQSFDRRGGRFQPKAGMRRAGGVLLVPILHGTDRKQKPSWSSLSPALEDMRRYTFAFLGESTPVRVSPPAFLWETDTRNKNGKSSPPRLEWTPPAGSDGPARWVTVRRSRGRTQVHVESVLACLTDLTDVAAEGGDAASMPHSVVGLTMADLHSCDSDLFIAGLAAGRSRVAAFSLFRYHPHIRMSPSLWHRYGFASRKGDYSYFEDFDPVEFISDDGSVSAGTPDRNRKRKRPLRLALPLPRSLTASSKLEYLRRSVKLLTHEILHLYLVDHCVYGSCLMNGTGHLVEDFAAPSHLCGVDLRKLQFRFGFDCRRRYERLADLWSEWGSTAEARWCRKQAAALPESFLALEVCETADGQKDGSMKNKLTKSRR